MRMAMLNESKVAKIVMTSHIRESKVVAHLSILDVENTMAQGGPRSDTRDL